MRIERHQRMDPSHLVIREAQHMCMLIYEYVRTHVGVGTSGPLCFEADCLSADRELQPSSV
jgi:hypothetical protein